MSPPVRVLLVEDDHEDARLFKRHAPSRYAIEHVTNPAAARRLLEQRRFDLCFVAFRLGADNGLETVRGLRALRSDLPIIVVTGQEARDLGENALLAGATDFVPKNSLSAAAIERAGRWALIRRHAERSVHDEASSRALARTLARPPPVAATPQALRRLAYLSWAREVLAPPELLALCAKAAAANARLDVTGVLVMAGDRFMQVLEGPPESVAALLERIAADPRHGGLAIVLDEVVTRRLYADWNMGYLQIGERHPISAESWAEVTRNATKGLSQIGGDRAALDAFIAEMPRWLRAAVASSP